MTAVLAAPDLSAWRAGNTGVEGVWQFKSALPGQNVLLSAIMHGNEVCGAWALKELLDEGILPARGALTLAFCNLAAFDRFDPQNVDASRFVEQDMNRVWSDAVLSAGETLEARRAAAIAPFVREADWALDLHSMHEPSAPLLLCGMQPRNLALQQAWKLLSMWWSTPDTVTACACATIRSLGNMTTRARDRS